MHPDRMSAGVARHGSSAVQPCSKSTCYALLCTGEHTQISGKFGWLEECTCHLLLYTCPQSLAHCMLCGNVMFCVLQDRAGRTLRETLNAIKCQDSGVYVQASTLGSLEALVEFLNQSKIPVGSMSLVCALQWLRPSGCCFTVCSTLE